MISTPKISGVESTRSPLFSVIVCTHNGSSTLRSCLVALSQQTYTHHEVLVIDDGSIDSTAEIARSFDFVRYYRQEHAGLSAARNHGMNLANGELLAYTDDDCIPDEDWLHHLSTAFDAPEWVAAGGPNIPPPPRNSTEACVAAAPGAPSQVLLSDEEAEHLPGCNLAIRKSALLAIRGFNIEFKTAGDDVDVCWRLQSNGGKLRFVPAAVVWHHRRFTVQSYLRQQSGYGHAEALLIANYPQRFSWFSGAHWRGAIYGDDGQLRTLDQQTIRFGAHGLAPFQCIYASSYSSPWQLLTGLPWLTLILLTLSMGLLFWPLLIIAGLMMALSLMTPLQRAISRDFMFNHPTRTQKILLFFLCYTQPIVRDWARLRGMMILQAWPGAGFQWSWPKRQQALYKPNSSWSHETFWSEVGITRDDLLPIMQQLAPDHDLQWCLTGEHSLCDAELITKDGGHFGLTSVTEYHEGSRRLTRFAFGPASWISKFKNKDQIRHLLYASAKLAGIDQNRS